MSTAKWIAGACCFAVFPLLLHAQEATAEARRQPPVLTRLQINGAAATVPAGEAPLRLEHEMAGALPTEYRVSARADMAGARWAPYVSGLQLRDWQRLVSHAPCDGARPGQRLLLFLQVRADMGGDVRIVNGQRTLMPRKIESNIVGDAICVVNDP